VKCVARRIGRSAENVGRDAHRAANKNCVDTNFSAGVEARLSLRFVLALSLLAPAAIAAPPSIPGDIDGPADDAEGIYTVSWNASIGTVTAYKLEENTVEIYAGLNRAFKMPAARSGAKTYRVRACNIA
jgi:hypothetical protein